MSRSRLNSLVARATGESLSTIRSRGFSVLELEVPVPDVADSLCLSCPGCGTDVPLPAASDGTLPEWAECDQCDIAYPYHHDEVFLPDLAVA